MSHYATDLSRIRALRSLRALAVLSIGPAAMLAGVVWAFVQPWRVTLLHPQHQGFWWLVVEPPLLVVLVGLVFAVIAVGIVHDLEETERG